MEVDAITMYDILSGWKGTGLSLCVVHQVSRTSNGNGQAFHSIDVVFPGSLKDQRSHLVSCISLPPHKGTNKNKNSTAMNQKQNESETE
jgi:hypothetical protein